MRKTKLHPYIIYWAIAVHMAWGFALVADPTVPPVAILVGLHWILALGLNSQIVGLLLIAAAATAAFGLYLDRRISSSASFLMLLPQYGILIASLVADVGSIISGEVADRSVDRLLLFTVLWPVIVAALFHSLAIIERQLAWNKP